MTNSKINKKEISNNLSFSCLNKHLPNSEMKYINWRRSQRIQFIKPVRLPLQMNVKLLKSANGKTSWECIVKNLFFLVNEEIKNEENKRHFFTKKNYERITNIKSLFLYQYEDVHQLSNDQRMWIYYAAEHWVCFE